MDIDVSGGGNIAVGFDCGKVRAGRGDSEVYPPERFGNIALGGGLVAFRLIARLDDTGSCIALHNLQ